MNFQVLQDSNDIDYEEEYEISKLNNRQDWISVKDRLPEDRILVWIYAVYEDSAYDNVKSRVSIGVYYNNEAWTDVLDAPFANDYTVLYWMPLKFPEKPDQKY